ELREKHLKAAPSRLPGSARLAQLASMCLRKVPAGRPDLSSVRRQLQAVIEAMAAPRHDQRAATGATVADEIAKRDSEEHCTAREGAARRQLAQEATVALQDIFSELDQAVRSAAPVAQFSRSHRGGGQITLGRGTLAWDVLFPNIEPGQFSQSK